MFLVDACGVELSNYYFNAEFKYIFFFFIIIHYKNSFVGLVKKFVWCFIAVYDWPQNSRFRYIEAKIRQLFKSEV